MTADPRERLLDLLSTEATQGLTEDEVRELRGLLLIVPDEDPDSLAYAAAAADLFLTDRPGKLPPALARQIERQGTAFFANAPVPAPPPRRPRTPRSTYIAWALVAGLGAILLWTQRPRPVAITPTPEQMFIQLSAEPASKGYVGEKESAKGEVVWNGDKQEGCLKLSGLAVLDPAKQQYQLWIADPSQDHPVDGGVFDVNADGTATVLIHAKIKVKSAQLFAVTRESVGGVVVSKATHLLVLMPK